MRKTHNSIYELQEFEPLVMFYNPSTSYTQQGVGTKELGFNNERFSQIKNLPASLKSL